MIIGVLMRPDSRDRPIAQGGALKYGVARGRVALPIPCFLVGGDGWAAKSNIEIHRTGQVATGESGIERTAQADSGSVKNDARDNWYSHGR